MSGGRTEMLVWKQLEARGPRRARKNAEATGALRESLGIDDVPFGLLLDESIRRRSILLNKGRS